MSNDSRSLVETLQARSGRHADRDAVIILDGDREQAIQFAMVDQRARGVASLLQGVIGPGDRVLLLYPPGLDYVVGFLGCLYAGVVAVPVYPPDPSRLQRQLPRLQAIARDARATAVITTSAILGMTSFLAPLAPELVALPWRATDKVEAGSEATWRMPELNRETLAFLQYTSGSTGDPKGVMVSHGNLLENLARITAAFGIDSESVGVCWLPPYHDMGLIGGILGALANGRPTALMSPLDFLRQPLRWLRAISRLRATISGGPNSSYDLCVRKISAEDRESLDLSSWRLAFSGAEPVRIDTIDRFATAFAPCGFRREAFYPCYGLAETTLIASGGERDEAAIVSQLDAAALAQHDATPAAADDANRYSIVSCGRQMAGHEIAIVDPESGSRVADRRIGEIFLRGPSVASGYWGRPELTEQTFHARIAGSPDHYLRTGDLGFLDGGELYVTGRTKDLIIIRGRNHYPQDFETTVERSHAAVRPGCSAAVSYDHDGEERLVIVAELERDKQAATPLDPMIVIAAIRETVSAQHEVAVHAIALLPAGAMPKTSSGKIQRRACRDGFVASSLGAVAQWVAS